MTAMKFLNALMVVCFFAALQLALTWLAMREGGANAQVLWGGGVIYLGFFVALVGCVWKAFDETWRN